MVETAWMQEFTDVVQCTICINTFKEPRQLPCLHSFCTTCLQDDINARVNLGIYICPQCRMECPNGGVDTFPINFHLKQVVDVYKSRLRVQEASDDFVCSKHNKDINYYCTKCDQGVCVECLRTTCRHVQSIVDEEMMREVVKLAVERTRNAMKKTDDKLCQASDEYNKTKNALADNRKEVEESVDKLISVVQSARDDYLDKMKSKFTVRMKDIQHESKILEKVIQSVKDGVEQIKNLPTMKLKEMASAKKQIESFKEGEHDFDVSEAITADYTLEQSLGDNIKALCGRLGEVVLKEKVSEFSVARGAGVDGLGITGIAVMTSGHILCVDGLGLRKFDQGGTMSHDFEYVLSPFDCVTSVNEQGQESIFVSDRDGMIVNLAIDGVKQKVLSLSFHPIGLALTSKRQFVVSGDTTDGACVCLLSEDGKVLHDPSWKRNVNEIFEKPCNVAVNSKDEIIVSDWKKKAVFFLNEDSELTKRYEPKTDMEKLLCPRGVTTDVCDFIYICDQVRNRVIMLTPDGDFRREVLTEADGLSAPLSICFDAKGHLVVGEEGGTLKVFQIRI